MGKKLKVVRLIPTAGDSKIDCSGPGEEWKDSWIMESFEQNCAAIEIVLGTHLRLCSINSVFAMNCTAKINDLDALFAYFQCSAINFCIPKELLLDIQYFDDMLMESSLTLQQLSISFRFNSPHVLDSKPFQPNQMLVTSPTLSSPQKHPLGIRSGSWDLNFSHFSRAAHSFFDPQLMEINDKSAFAQQLIAFGCDSTQLFIANFHIPRKREWHEEKFFNFSLRCGDVFNFSPPPHSSCFRFFRYISLRGMKKRATCLHTGRGRETREAETAKSEKSIEIRSLFLVWNRILFSSQKSRAKSFSFPFAATAFDEPRRQERSVRMR